MNLFSAHFQLTGRCNLSCGFCGQAHGMLAGSPVELPPAVWRRAAAALQQTAADAGRQPRVVLWGGEPLLSESFPVLARELAAAGFRVEVISNGTLIERHVDVLNECIDNIYISLDGPAETHDRLRGKGTFRLLEKNLPLLKNRKGNLIFLTTLSDENVADMARLPLELAGLRPDRIILQPLMYLSSTEIDAYRRYSRAWFDGDYPELAAWRRDDDDDYRRRLAEGLQAVERTVYPMPVSFTPHASMASGDTPPCRMPSCRVHIRHDGEVGFCTDYFGFSAGNIRRQSLEQIFAGERAETFRRAVRDGKLPICRHCPWRFAVPPLSESSKKITAPARPCCSN
jgi:MoaA/NifB/PqqE/SkfB family radical SAM enzyme